MYDGGKTFIYTALLALANELAERLRKLLTDAPSSASYKAPEDASVIKVGVLLGASVEFVVAILAVRQCGLAFVPLEPSWPVRRIARVVADSEPLILLTNQQANDALTELIDKSLSTLCFDVEDLQHPCDPLINPCVTHCTCFCHTMAIRPYCYVLYTSRSLGEPKGVYGTETGLLHCLRWMQKEYPFFEGDVAILKTAVAFVDHLTELFGPLLGGSLIVVPPSV
ncbi:hypothetical protein L7F22_031614 [Adiantum nelumboides]|nr:hypothetical protein [Adiantum nelumboides]